MGLREKIVRVLGPRPGSPVWKWQHRREVKVKKTKKPPYERFNKMLEPKRRIILLAIICVIGFGAGVIYYGLAQMNDATNLVKNHYIDAYLTTGDMIQDDIESLLSAGLQARGEWNVTNDSGGWYIVTVHEQIKEFGEWVDFQVMQWRVNPSTKEIVALDDTARSYL